MSDKVRDLWANYQITALFLPLKPSRMATDIY